MMAICRSQSVKEFLDKGQFYLEWSKGLLSKGSESDTSTIWRAITDLLASPACGSSTWVERARRWYATSPNVDRVADGIPH